jgi:hypothetical protein
MFLKKGRGALWVCLWNRGGAVGVFMEPRGRCGCVYGTEGAADRKCLGTAAVDVSVRGLSSWKC